MTESLSQTGVVPPEAEALIALLNSRPHATPTTPDLLDEPTTAAEVVRPFASPAGRESLDRARTLRADLVDVLLARDPAAGWRSLTEHTADVTLGYGFTASGEAELRQLDGDPLAGAITKTVADLIGSGRWLRVRICANEDCQHAFYDTTRSRTQRWHSYEVCGNRHNAAAYRARHSGR